MKIFTVVFLLLSGLAAHAQTYFIDTVKQGRSNRIGTTNRPDKQSQSVYHPGWPIDGDRKNKTPGKFRTDTITKEQFEKYAENYRTGINTDSSLVLWTDSSFSIKTPKSLEVFDTRQERNHDIAFEYRGFITSLNLYSIVGEEMNESQRC